MLAFFGIGPIELIIMGAIVLIPVAIVVALVAALTRNRHVLGHMVSEERGDENN